MFGDVFNEASKYVYRSSRLEERVAALAQALQERKEDETGEFTQSCVVGAFTDYNGDSGTKRQTTLILNQRIYSLIQILMNSG